MGNCSRRAVPPIDVRVPVTPATLPAVFSLPRRRWRRAIRFVAQLLRKRKEWAAYGVYLQGLAIRSLVSGLERRSGQLVRVRPGQ